MTYLTHANRLPDAGFSAVYHSSFSAEIVANILAGVWDCGFVLKPVQTYGLEGIPVICDQWGLVMLNDHRLARQRSVSLQDIGNYKTKKPSATIEYDVVSAKTNQWVFHTVDKPVKIGKQAARFLVAAMDQRAQLVEKQLFQLWPPVQTYTTLTGLPLRAAAVTLSPDCAKTHGFPLQSKFCGVFIYLSFQCEFPSTAGLWLTRARGG